LIFWNGIHKKLEISSQILICYITIKKYRHLMIDLDLYEIPTPRYTGILLLWPEKKTLQNETTSEPFRIDYTTSATFNFIDGYE